MPIPTSVLTAVAPMLIDKFADRVLGGATSTPAVDMHPNQHASTKPNPPALDLPDPVVGMVREYFDHQKEKASVRPAIMRRMGNTTLLNAVAILGLAVAHAVGFVEAEALFNAAMVIGGVATGTGGAYLYGHTTRSIEKSKGAE